METPDKLLNSDPVVLRNIINDLTNILIKKENDIEEKEINHKKELIEKESKIRFLNTEVEKLRFMLNKQLAHRFGSHSEKCEVEQLNLFDEAVLEAVDVAEVEEAEESITVASHTRTKTGRKPLPQDLPREEVVHDLLDDEKICDCGHALHKIGEDISEQLDIIPARMKVIRHIRYKYGCRECEEGVKSAELPKQPIPKSIASAGLLSHVLVSKYVDHLPLYRQEMMLQRMGVDIARSTLCHWMIRCARLLTPLVELLKEGVRQSSYVQADETPLQVLNEPERANEKKSYCWVYRAMGPPLKTSIVFEYHPSRSGEIAENFLKDFKGKLQTDGYGGYNGLRQRKDIEGYGCLAHARRKFMDIVKTVKKVGKAHQALVFIGKLYQLEKEAREKAMNAEERKALRSEKAKPILKKFKEWLESSIKQVPPQSAIGKAIKYCVNQWGYLEKYSDDGEVEIDTNLVENAIRPLALGRRNWLFAGSVEGAESSCIIFSLLQTCRANEIEPYAYFKVILSEIVKCETKEDYQKQLPQFIDREKLREAYL